ncbi:hypothetical protein A0J61_03390 [Choanephora cucurbitarum]|uniref:UBA domain-containing protein n=1 Tax=Choanephora cucurbitarum TaxID=101091 RepID=A0A1C7NHU9_9FUNG|nr:hypothetical protein A0J61_03390 [Choanephora cucurbitarum]
MKEKTRSLLDDEKEGLEKKQPTSNEQLAQSEAKSSVRAANTDGGPRSSIVEESDGTDDDFFDAVEASSNPKTAPTLNTSAKTPSATDESEFVFIDHPAQNAGEDMRAPVTPKNPSTKSNSDITIANSSTTPSKKPAAEMQSVELTGSNSRSNLKEPASLEPRRQQQQYHHDEEDSVFISSLSESEISDRFTSSTNSSTHRVAPPPPPQSRQVTSGHTTPQTYKSQAKKPPAASPQPRKESNTIFTPRTSQQDDTIFGSPSLPISTKEEDEFDAYFADDKFLSGNGENSKENNAVGMVTQSAVTDATPTGFGSNLDQTSFNQSTFGAPNKMQNEGNQHTSNTVHYKDIGNSFSQAPGENTLKDENQGVNNSIRGDNDQNFKSKSSSTSIKAVPLINESEEGEEDRITIEDKKKKKKNIISWAKNIGSFSSHDGDKKKGKKDKKKEIKKKKSFSERISGPSTKEAGLQVPASSIPDEANSHREDTLSHTNAFELDLDTIRGSHVAELVNMGFHPQAAMDALDRYDQDVEKATNFLLDQA